MYKSRLIIERTRCIVLDNVVAFDLSEGGPIPPCFQIQLKPTITSKQAKKQKQKT
jgi:hypothetical protein